MNSNIIIVIFSVLLIGFMIFSSRRNRKRQDDLRSAIVPGVEVMTNFGMFGKLLSIDEATNVAEIETTPGTIVRVHRQTLSKVVTPDELAPTTGDTPRSVEEAMATVPVSVCPAGPIESTPVLVTLPLR